MQTSATTKHISLIILPVILLLLGYIIDMGPISPYVIINCVVITLVIHLILAIPAILMQTEKFFDISGTVAVLVMLFYAACNSNAWSNRASLLLAICCCWTVRLGLFLLFRVVKHRKDKRFDQIKQDLASFALAWQMSAVWTFVTTMCAIAAITSEIQVNLSYLDIAFFIIWLFGFIVEITADTQKFIFKEKYGKENFISTGLWQYCRHPNYFGEITMWLAIAALSYPNLSSWSYISLLSPLFVIFLLTKISGTNILEKNNDNKFGHSTEYKMYKQCTPLIVPKIFR